MVATTNEAFSILSALVVVLRSFASSGLCFGSNLGKDAFLALLPGALGFATSCKVIDLATILANGLSVWANVGQVLV